jgi:lipooligosaccharide transport system permease protein
VLAVRAFDYWCTVYRRVWRGSIISSFVLPVLYLAAMGVGLGHYVSGGGATQQLAGLTYLQFVAPGLLATTAMQTAVSECTYPVLSNLKWQKVFEAMICTPLRVSDVLAGQIGYVAFRLVTTCAVLALVLGLFGAVLSAAGAALAVLVAVVTGLAFATPIVAFVGTLENDSGLALLFRLGIIPMFLFSGAFFPTSQLPAALEWLATVTPVWHGVTLCRDLTSGQATLAGGAAHLAYLSAWGLAGWWLAARSLTRRLTR